MELPWLGEHCSERSCKQLDFLPLKCDACGENVQVPVCPLCNTPIPVQKGEIPDIVVGAHIDKDCKYNPAQQKQKIFTNKCTKPGCKRKEMMKVVCEQCGGSFCIKHRHPLDHDCRGSSQKRKHGNQFASWKLSSEVFSPSVKAHPWPLPTHCTRPHQDTGTAVSHFRICQDLEPLGSAGSEPFSREPPLSVSAADPRPACCHQQHQGAPGWLPPAVLRCGEGAARMRLDPGQAPGIPVRMRVDPCRALGGVPAGCGSVPVRMRADPGQAQHGPDFGYLPSQWAGPQAELGAEK
uniref:Zinc finger AN1-type containing 2A n=1 Tax=Serinus canaria TaxID=9135 RepID=A0A8C9N4Z9_SERCA